MALSASIIRLRTLADERGRVTGRWPATARCDIDGLRFHRGSWARATLKDSTELRAVTFATLPHLTEASSGRVPNPYR